MSTISIRKILNLFKRKNNKYTSDITHSSGSESNRSEERRIGKEC